jgi:exodeoxyribonuclease VII small subunit
VRYEQLSMTQKTNLGTATAPATADFERSLAELENIVARLEQGELTLDESLQQFERGVGLTRICQSALQQAEQKIEILMRKGSNNNPDGEPELTAMPFEPDAESHDP